MGQEYPDVRLMVIEPQGFLLKEAECQSILFTSQVLTSYMSGQYF